VSIFVDVGRLLHEIDPDSGAHTGAIPPPADAACERADQR